MVSKAAKLRSKRKTQAGRPRKADVERFPCGKVKPFETEKENMSVALDARKRIHGVEDKAGLSGYTAGRMVLDGKINDVQLKAGNTYAEDAMRYYAAVGIPFPSARAQSLGKVRGHDGEVSEDRARKARQASNRMMHNEGVLLRCIDGPQVKQTVHNLFVMDYETLRTMPGQQLLWLRRGLNALKDDQGLRE